MGQDVWYVLDKRVLERSEASALSTSSPRHAHHPPVQTFPVWDVIHGRYENITNVDFTLTEPSQMIGSQGQGRVANDGLHLCTSPVEAREASITPWC
jgi:hypothetical protein